MSIEQPIQPVSLLRELNLLPFPGEGPIGSEPYFTGWKFAPDGDGTGAVGQIIQRIPTPAECNGSWAAYCNLPGMEVGKVPEGGLINIGTGRLTGEVTLDQMREMLTAGLAKLKEYVAGLEHECLRCTQACDCAAILFDEDGHRNFCEHRCDPHDIGTDVDSE